jgi:hypothetical protein
MCILIIQTQFFSLLEHFGHDFAAAAGSWAGEGRIRREWKSKTWLVTSQRDAVLKIKRLVRIDLLKSEDQ